MEFDSDMNRYIVCFVCADVDLECNLDMNLVLELCVCLFGLNFDLALVSASDLWVGLA